MARFIKNIGWASAAQFSASLAAFAYTLLTARFLGVEHYGLFQAAMGVYGLFSIVHLFLYFGAVHCTGKSSPSQRPAVLGALMTLSVLLSAVILLFFFLSCKAGMHILKAPGPGIWLVCGALIAANSLLTLFYGTLQAEHRFRIFASSKTVEVTLTLLLGFLFMNSQAGAAGAIGGYAAAMTLISLYFWITLRPKLQLSNLRSILSQEFQSLKQLTTVLLFLLILEHLPAVWARSFLPASDSGHFAAIYNLRNTVWPFALSITLTFYAHLVAKDPMPGLFRQSLLFILMLGGGFELASILAGQPIIRVLYGPEFLSSASLLPRYGISLALQMIVMLFLFDLTGRGRLKLMPMIAGLAVFAAALRQLGGTSEGIVTAQIISAAACLCVITVNRLIRN